VSSDTEKQENVVDLEETKPSKVKRRKHQASKEVVMALRDALDACYEEAFDNFAILLYNSDNDSTHTDTGFEKPMAFMNGLEILKVHQLTPVITLVEEEDEDET